MKILLTGAAGQLGRELAATLPALGKVDAISRAQLDLADTEALRRLVRERKPDLIVNAAAYTAVDQAESDARRAFLVNASVPEVLAQEAQALGSALIHFSTDYVFDGAGEEPYDEQAAVAPLNVYGKSKAAGEAAIAAHCDAYWIFRTSWLYSAHGRNFLTTIARVACEKTELRVVDDQWGAPTWTGTVASTLDILLGRSLDCSLSETVRKTGGIYHLAAAGATNWHAYARRIVEALHEAGIALALSPDHIHPLSTAQYHTKALRPLNSRLSCAKFNHAFGISLPAWETALAQCMKKMPPPLF